MPSTFKSTPSLAPPSKSDIMKRMATQNGFVSGTKPAIVAKQLMAERQYNRAYYNANKDDIMMERKKAAAEQKKQQKTLYKRSESDTKASQAQAENAARKRQHRIINTIVQNHTLAQRSKQDTEASKAQAAAARQRSHLSRIKYRNIKQSEAQDRASRNRMIRKRLERSKQATAQRSANQTAAYADARKKQVAYNNSVEGRFTRAMSRALTRSKKFNNSYNKINKNLGVLLKNYFK